MINATELRIGNLVEYTDEIFPVDGVIVKSLNLVHVRKLACLRDPNTHRGKQFYEMIRGITITEKWLLLLGFKQTAPGGVFRAPNSFMHVTTPLGNGIYAFENGQPFTKVFRHVHQLQNLYFSVMQEELSLPENSGKEPG